MPASGDSSDEAAGTDRDRAEERRRRAGRRLLQVLLCDASSCTALIAVAVAMRSRASGGEYAAIARTAVAGFLPGAGVVLRERRGHRGPIAQPHRMVTTVLLVGAAAVITTVGSIRILAHAAPGHPSLRPATATAGALLVAGNAIGVPYLVLIGRLHYGSGPGVDRCP